MGQMEAVTYGINEKNWQSALLASNPVLPESISTARDYASIEMVGSSIRGGRWPDDRPKAHLSGAALAHPCAARHSCILHVACHMIMPGVRPTALTPGYLKGVLLSRDECLLRFVANSRESDAPNRLVR